MARHRSHPIALWLLVVVALAASSAFVGWRLFGPSDGGLISFYGDAWSADGVQVEELPGTPGGLRGGDLVLGVAGRSINEWLDRAADPTLERLAAAGDQPLAYTVERDGSRLSVPVTLTRHDASPHLLDNWGNLLFAGVLLAIGLYVLYRRPELEAARALTVASIAAGASVVPWMLGLHVSDIHLGWPFLLYVLTVSPLYMLLWPAGALHLPLALMPGRGREMKWLRPRVLVALYAVPLVGYVAALALTRLASPTTSAWMGTWPLAQGVVIVPCVVAGVGLAAVAYRRAGSDTQRQLRWALVGASTAAIVTMALMFLPQLLLGRPLISWHLIGLLALPMPIGLAVAIVRHRLFDIEVVINRTLVYGGVTFAILAIYASTVLVVGAVLPQGAGFAASLLATGVAAIAALPVRDQLQRTVNRLMYGDRDDPYRALSRLGTRLEAALDPLEVPAVVVRMVAESLRLPWVALRLNRGDGAERLIEHGQPPGWATVSVPLVYGAEVVGDLVVAPRAADEPLSPADLRLLEALARQAGAAAHASRLTRDLIDSRERLVAAREEERRRIRRDLHDGLGPTLATIGMRAELAADLVNRDPEAAGSILEQLSGEVGQGLAEIRRLVDGLRPPSLDELGLVEAVRAEADRLGPPPIFEVAADESLPDLPAAIEVAAYRICVEAMTNAARHADARRSWVRLAMRPADRAEHVGRATLRVEVTDDGRGLPDQVRPGIGLASMRERAAEIGGTLELGSADGGGTRILAHLPLARAEAG